MSKSAPSIMYAQRRFRSVCAFVQSDQNLHWVHFGSARMQSFLVCDNELDTDQTVDLTEDELIVFFSFFFPPEN